MAVSSVIETRTLKTSCFTTVLTFNALVSKLSVESVTNQKMFLFFQESRDLLTQSTTVAGSNFPALLLDHEQSLALSAQGGIVEKKEHASECENSLPRGDATRA